MSRDTVEEFHLLFAETQKAPSPAASDDVLRVLIAARKLIECAGHTKHPCATNALYEIAQSIELHMAAEPYLVRAVPVEAAHLHWDGLIRLWGWHDASDTTHAAVLALYDRAISSRLAEIEG